RPQARQRDDRRPWARPHHGLRAGRGRAAFGPLRLRGDARLHVSRAAHRRRDHRAHRPVRAGPDPLRDGVGPAILRRQDRGGARRAASRLQGAAPHQRGAPARARAVLALLPGSDPLEAAVAAGETPSPEIVAAAATVGDIPVGRAWLALAVVVGGFVAAAALADRMGYLQRALVPKTPEVMAERAREVLARLAPDGMA